MDKTIVDGQTTLFYREEGSGLPVILLHGFAEDNAIWNSQIDQLRAGYHVLALDFPGSGRSSAGYRKASHSTSDRSSQSRRSSSAGS